ncbi:SDR family oxidoreductase [Cribrihabitans neustonicus]|uniref:SDR family oxidoreductase n=1 Tax=Cribrihabitans neustonicus TaxID=1429085 RepID=UPI003B5A09FC
MRALVTGAGRRLGRAMALRLAAEGYDVAVHYRGSRTAAEETAEMIRGQGRRAVALQADLADEDATQGLLPGAAAALEGPITCLVNNASVFERDTIESATRESWDAHFSSNLRAPFLLLQAMAAQEDVPPLFPAGDGPEAEGCPEPRAWGLAVNMVDQRVLKLTPDFMSYTLAKSALWTLTRTAAQALAPRIRVNAIGPGPTLRGAQQSAEQFARQRASTILERGAGPGDIAAALAYLLAAPAVTGQMICVDGGQHLAWQTPDVCGLE